MAGLVDSTVIDTECPVCGHEIQLPLTVDLDEGTVTISGGSFTCPACDRVLTDDDFPEDDGDCHCCHGHCDLGGEG